MPAWCGGPLTLRHHLPASHPTLLGNGYGGADVRRGAVRRLLGAFDDADVVSMYGGKDEKSWGWSLADVVLTGLMNNRNRSNVILATRDHSFCCRASSPNTMVGIVQGWLTILAV